MAISLKHAFNSGKSDGVDATLVQPSNWNAEHTLQLATGKLVGRTTASTGAAEEIAVSGDLLLSLRLLHRSDQTSLLRLQWFFYQRTYQPLHRPSPP